MVSPILALYIGAVCVQDWCIVLLRFWGFWWLMFCKSLISEPRAGRDRDARGEYNVIIQGPRKGKALDEGKAFVG